MDIKECTYSNRQLWTIANFAKDKAVLHSGPFGCGKTHVIMIAFGLFCRRLLENELTGCTFILMARTQALAKKNMGNVLGKAFGDNFKYTQSKRDGITKDAVLFGQNILFVGLNDGSAESKFRGLTEIMGVIWDEIALCREEDWNYLQGRLRMNITKELIDKLPVGTVPCFVVASCNPDVPTHWCLKLVNNGLIKMIRWSMKDAIYNGADEFYKSLKLTYRGIKTFLQRYLYGMWVAGDKMVYPQFNNKIHVLEYDEDGNTLSINYSLMRRIVIGVDYGSNHPTAIVIACKTFEGDYIVTECYKMTRTAPSDIVHEIEKLMDKLVECGHPIDMIYIDPSSVGIKDELDKNGINYSNALNEHNAGISCISSLLSLEKLFIMACCEELVKEIYGYQYKDNTSGKDEVVKIDDDLCDAMRYAIYTDSVCS